MNELFLAIVVALLLGMIVMMFKYAKYIHKLPKTETKGDMDEPPSSDSSDNSDER